MQSDPLSLARAAGGEPAAPTLDTDAALAVRGDAASFLQLYETHVRAVYAYLLARLGHPQDAEDVTALVFEQVWTSLPRYRPTGSFKGWLFTIARRTLQHYRRRRPQATVPVEGLADLLPDPAGGPEEQILAADGVRQVFAIIATLSPEQQEVISLRFLAGLQYAEIAQATGKRESAVKMTAYRAVAEIRRRYDHATTQE